MRARCSGSASIRRQEAARKASKLAYWAGVLDVAMQDAEREIRADLAALDTAHNAPTAPPDGRKLEIV